MNHAYGLTFNYFKYKTKLGFYLLGLLVSFSPPIFAQGIEDSKNM